MSGKAECDIWQAGDFAAVYIPLHLFANTAAEHSKAAASGSSPVSDRQITLQAPIRVGSQGASLYTIVSTGTDVFWLQAAGCIGCTFTTYDPKQSTTAVPLNSQHPIVTYSDGTRIDCSLYKDSVTLGDVALPAATICVTNSYNQTTNPQRQSVLVSWQLQFNSITAGNTSFQFNGTVKPISFQPSTTFIYLDTNVADSINAALGFTRASNGDNVVDCAKLKTTTFPKLYMSVGTVLYTIGILNVVVNFQGNCISGIYGTTGENVLGSVFTRSFYTTFDYDTNSITTAQSTDIWNGEGLPGFDPPPILTTSAASSTPTSTFVPQASDSTASSLSIPLIVGAAVAAIALVAIISMTAVYFMYKKKAADRKNDEARRPLDPFNTPTTVLAADPTLPSSPTPSSQHTLPISTVGPSQLHPSQPYPQQQYQQQPLLATGSNTVDLLTLQQMSSAPPAYHEVHAVVVQTTQPSAEQPSTAQLSEKEIARQARLPVPTQDLLFSEGL
eukprot:jgi/Hompol1/760/HPOL_003916-RA